MRPRSGIPRRSPPSGASLLSAGRSRRREVFVEMRQPRDLCGSALRPGLRCARVPPMDKPDLPFITPDLVMPSLRTCEIGSHLYPALVFAERGPLVLFAAEYAKRFGVGVLNDEGRVVQADQYATLDDAA